MNASARFYARCLTAVLLAGVLCSCNTLPFKRLFAQQASHVKTAKTHYHADTYVEHVALARLAPEAAASDLKVIDAYAAQKPRPERLTIVVVDYKTTNDSTMQQVVAPVSSASKNAEFSALLRIMNRLGAVTLHNLRLAAVTVASDEALILPDTDVRQALDDQQQRLLDDAETLFSLEDARLQLQLARFFMEHRFRDAAYLAVDNVKRELASASQDTPADTAAVKTLSHELEATENQLHKDMPFTLSPQ